MKHVFDLMTSFVDVLSLTPCSCAEIKQSRGKIRRITTKNGIALARMASHPCKMKHVLCFLIIHIYIYIYVSSISIKLWVWNYLWKTHVRWCSPQCVQFPKQDISEPGEPVVCKKGRGTLPKSIAFISGNPEPAAHGEKPPISALFIWGPGPWVPNNILELWMIL